MIVDATPISPRLSDSLPRIGPASELGEPIQFQRSLGQATPIESDAPPAIDRAAPVLPVVEVQRATTQASPLGERVLQTLSSMYRDNAVAPAAVGHGIILANGALPGPAQQSLLQAEAAGIRMLDAAQERNSFEGMIAGLRDVYSGVTQVSLVSKGIGSVTSSLNKLISTG